jgi:GNAT superfamily N-acetyltransferase
MTPSVEEVFAVFQILEMMHAEIGQAMLDKEKALHEIESAAGTGYAWVALEDGKIIASIGLWPQSEWWYSREKAFFSKWLYVLPDHRKGGHVLRMLLNEVIDLVDSERIPAFVHVHNSMARRSVSSRRLGLIADEIGVFPSGRIFAFKALKQAA